MQFSTNQELFDFVTTAIIEQGKPSAKLVNQIIGDDDSYLQVYCLYRSDAGKCAAGHIIPDDRYKPEMEDVTAHSLFSNGLSDLLPDDDKALELLCCLQNCHDGAANKARSSDGFDNAMFLESVMQSFRETAVDFSLTINF